MEKREQIDRTLVRSLDHVLLYFDLDKNAEEAVQEVMVKFSLYEKETAVFVRDDGGLETLTPAESADLLATVEKKVLRIYSDRQKAAKLKPAEERNEKEAALVEFTDVEVPK